MINNAMMILTYIKIGAVVILLSAIGGVIYYIQWAKAEIAVLEKNNASLNIAIETSEATIRTMQSDYILAKKTQARTNKSFNNARRENARLQKLIAKHDLTKLALKKPTMIQTRVNNGTRNINRCFEIISGDSLTINEVNATKRSEINKSCSDIANPKFKEKK